MCLSNTMTMLHVRQCILGSAHNIRSTVALILPEHLGTWVSWIIAASCGDFEHRNFEAKQPKPINFPLIPVLLYCCYRWCAPSSRTLFAETWTWSTSTWRSPQTSSSMGECAKNHTNTFSQRIAKSWAKPCGVLSLGKPCYPVCCLGLAFGRFWRLRLQTWL